MIFPVSELIARARVYLDDDHNDTSGVLSPEAWLTLFNVEYQQLYRRWVRVGLITPACIDVEFTGPTVTLPITTVEGELEIVGAQVLAIVGVVENDDNRRMVYPASSTLGRAPLFSVTTGPATCWTATDGGDSITITLEPPDTGEYLVRYIPIAERVEADTEEVGLPYGADERVVLGLARRANLKSQTSSALLDRLIRDADEELGMVVSGRVNDDAPRVRVVPRNPLATPQPLLGFPRAPSLYRFV